MIGTLLMGVALAGAPIRFDRVDLLSETSGTWLHDEAARFGDTPTVVGLRFLEQIQPVIALPQGVQVGLALRTQSVRLERPVADGPWALNGGLQLGAGLPNGVVGGVAWRTGVLRLGCSLSVQSSATWARPVLDGWRTLPVLGVGIGPVRKGGDSKGPPRGGKAPWM